MRYGITIYGNCSWQRKEGIDRIIKHVVNNISYGSAYEKLELEEEMMALDILTFKQFHSYVILTNNYYNHGFKYEVQKRDLRRIKDSWLIKY